MAAQFAGMTDDAMAEVVQGAVDVVHVPQQKAAMTMDGHVRVEREIRGRQASRFPLEANEG